MHVSCFLLTFGFDTGRKVIISIDKTVEKVREWVIQVNGTFGECSGIVVCLLFGFCPYICIFVSKGNNEISVGWIRMESTDTSE